MLWTTNGRMYELPFKFCLCILNIFHTEIVIFLPLVTFVSLCRGNFSDLKNKHSRLVSESSAHSLSNEFLLRRVPSLQTFLK